MIATPSSSTAMMKVSRNCPSGIIGLITLDDEEEGTAENTENAEVGLVSSPKLLCGLCALCGSFWYVGIQRFGYEPPDSTLGSGAVNGVCAMCSGRSCSCGAALWPSASINARRTTW